ncbi:SRPBCC family protein [Mycobacterium sp. NPDC003323]
MPINHDDGKRWLELNLVVPGTPEQVWRAVATGAGNSAWFTQTEIDERVGGAIRFDFGPSGSSEGEVTEWDPPRRIGYVERDWCGDAPPVATEITVTARSGDRCVIRMVHSLFTDADDWDDQIEGFESGWPGHFAILQSYLAHFPDRPAATFHISAGADGTEPWKRFTAAFGVDGVDVGDLRTIGVVADNINGQVERIYQDQRQRYMLLRLAEPIPGLIQLGMHTSPEHAVVGINAFFYGDKAREDAELSRASWQRLLDDTPS